VTCESAADLAHCCLVVGSQLGALSRVS
jgi:hypothetical protein